jgi:hypothetical protein
MSYDRNAPLLETGPIASAVIVGAILFIGMPVWAVIKWLAKH